MSDARKRAEEALARIPNGWVDPLVLILERALRALLAETAPAPPQAREVEEAAERLRRLLTPPCNMTPDGYVFFSAEDVEAVLRSLAARGGE